MAWWSAIYYKAGLAINQTLARDDAAYALGLTATIKGGRRAAADPGRAHAQLSRAVNPYPGAPHPLRHGPDLALHHAGSGHYRAALPAMSTGKWHAQLVDGASTWRISGVVHLPLDSARHPGRINRSTTTTRRLT